MEGPTSSGGLRNRLTCLTLQEHDDDEYMSYWKYMSRPTDEECLSVCLLNVLNNDKLEARKDIFFFFRSKGSNEIC